MNVSENKHPNGFTLTEVVIALGIVTILLTSFLAVFAPATKNIRKAITTQESGRIISAVESFFNNGVNFGTSSDTAFDQVLDILEESQKGVDNGEFKDNATLKSGLLFYNYRIRLSNTDAEAATGVDLKAGVDYTTIPAVRRFSDLNNASLNMREELEAIEGRLFFIRLQQLVEDKSNGILKPVDGGTIQAQKEGLDILDASFNVKAEIFVIPTIDSGYLDRLLASGTAQDIGEPLLSRNLTINR